MTKFTKYLIISNTRLNVVNLSHTCPYKLCHTNVPDDSDYDCNFLIKV